MPAPRSPRRRRGLSLIEMMIAILLMTVVFGVSVAFFRAQTRAVDAGAGRLDALQSARYALQQIERELREAGGVTGQPVIVMAAPLALTFNANVRSRTTDPQAEIVDAGYDSLAVEGFRVSRARALPLVSKTYPTINYRDENGDTTRAETISYFLRPDTISGRSDMYVLYRRANDRDSTVVTRNLQIPTDTAWFFRYQRVTSTGTLSTIATSALPLYWDATSGWADSIRIVDLRLSGIYRDRRRGVDVTRTIYASVRVANGGRTTRRLCGAAPAAPGTPTVANYTLYTFGTRVGNRVSWAASSDDNPTTGARDVVSYVVSKRPGSGTWVPVGTVAARRSTTNYRWDDMMPDSGTVQYAVQAVDCGGLSSTLSTSGNVVYP